MMTALAEGAREISVPDTVIAPPGVRVWEETMYWEREFGETVRVPVVRIGRVAAPVTSC